MVAGVPEADVMVAGVPEAGVLVAEVPVDGILVSGLITGSPLAGLAGNGMLGMGVLEGHRVGICAGGGPQGVRGGGGCVLVVDLSGRCVGCGVLGVGILAGSHGCRCSDVGVSLVVQ